MSILRFCLAVLMMAFTSISFAAPITYEFTASGFQSDISGSSAPDLNITGSFEVDGASVTDIDLTIGGHTYAVSEVGFWDLSGLLGGLACNVNCINGSTNDFWLSFNTDTLTFDNFFYSIAGINDIWYSVTGNVTLESTHVPEPSSLLLMLLGVVGFIARFIKLGS